MGYIITSFMLFIAFLAVLHWYNLFKLLRYCKKHWPEPYRDLTRFGFFAGDQAIYKQYDIDDSLFIALQRRARVTQTITNIILIGGIIFLACFFIFIK
jgi:hypothetical protein